jgi:hypothetical protein
VQVGRAPAEELDRREDVAREQLEVDRWLGVEQLERMRRGRRRPCADRATVEVTQHAVEVATERVAVPGVRVALVLDVFVQHRDGRRSSRRAAVLDRTEQRRRVLELHAGERAPELDFGTDPRLEAPDRLQDQLVVELQ